MTTLLQRIKEKRFQQKLNEKLQELQDEQIRVLSEKEREKQFQRELRKEINDFINK